MEYGNVTLSWETGGPVTVVSADPIVGMSTYTLSMYGCIATTTDDGDLLIGDIGTVRYRPIRFADNGKVVICERVD